MKLLKFYCSAVLLVLTISGLPAQSQVHSPLSFRFFGILEAHALAQQLGSRAELTPDQLSAILLLARTRPTSEIGHFVSRIARERAFKNSSPFSNDPLVSDLKDLLRKLSVWNSQDVRLLNGVVVAAFVLAAVTIDDPRNEGIAQLQEIQNSLKLGHSDPTGAKENLFPEAVRSNAARALVQLKLMKLHGERPFVDLIYGPSATLENYNCLWELSN